MDSPDSDDNTPADSETQFTMLESATSVPESTSPHHNDCSKKSNTVKYEGRQRVCHFNNLTNGGDHIKVNNGDCQQSSSCIGIPSGASTSRGHVSDSNDLDLYMRNNVDSHSDVEKCPSKVRNGALDVSGRRKCRRARCSQEEDSSSGNEAEEECCVTYKYKGSLHADLPSSFFTLDRLANGLDNSADEPAQDQERDENNHSQAGSSPDNDFLEMDFDPGPSLDLDSEDEADRDLQEERISPVPELPIENLENDLSATNETPESADYVNNVTDRREGAECSPQPGPSTSKHVPPVHRTSACLQLPTWGCRSSSQRSWPVRDPLNHCCSGDLCSPWDAPELESSEALAFRNANTIRMESEGSSDTRKYNLFSDLYHCIMAKRLVMEKNATFSDVTKSQLTDEANEGREEQTLPVDRTMIWSEQEACNKQVTQISTSACGATAVINGMVALNTPFSLEKLKKGVATRMRQESAALPQYLISRSIAGATHEDIMRGVDIASDSCLFARFFHMYPDRRVSLSKWLSYWMKKGAVPIATLNLQAGLAPGSSVPDAWHHQMIFGVSPRGIYLTNPLECVAEEALWPQLSSPSVLKVKRSDVLLRWTNSTDLRPLMTQPDVRWKKMNVLGQVINVVRESLAGSQGRTMTHHITIPAAYRSGITLIIPRDSPGFEELSSHPELPLLGH